MNKLTCTKSGNYYIPDLTLEEQPDTPIGKYGRMRQRYLNEHRPVLYNQLLLQGKLYDHLLEVDKRANARMEVLMPQLMQAAGVTEELKISNQMKWVRLMNTLKAQAEKIIRDELIFD